MKASAVPHGFDFCAVAANAVDMLDCPVFPLRAKGDIPCRWGTQSSKDPAQHATWARSVSGITGCGIALDAHLYVFDADCPEAVAWCEQRLPPTLTVDTHRGRHFYLQTTQRLRLLGVGLGPMLGVPKLDGKTLGGYVVAPGSVHRSGFVYAVHDDRPVARMPARLERRIGPRPDVSALSGSDVAPTAAEQAAWAANTPWGIALLDEAMDDALVVVRQLEAYAALSDHGWSDAWRDAGVALGVHLPSGALPFDECVRLLEDTLTRLDTWGCDPSHVLRSLRRGLLYGARSEADASA